MTPTFVHGKNTRILANGTDVSQWFKTWNAKRQGDTAETSTIGSSAKSYVGGLTDGVFSLDGYADGTASGIDGILNPVLGTATTVITAVGGVDAVGAPAVCGLTIENDLEYNADVGAAVSIKATGQTTAGMDAALVLHPLGQETSGSTGTSIDNGAATSKGLNSYLHVTAVGTTLTVKVQHSTDNSTWVDLATHTAVTTAPGFEKIAIATGTTVRRYIVTTWTQTGNATFHHAAARL